MRELNTRPDVLLLHLGANDIGVVPMKELRTQMKADLHYIHSLLPACQVIWSAMLPRQQWRPNVPVANLERCRQEVDRAVGRCVYWLGGAIIKHAQIDKSTPGIYDPTDGVHLTFLGNDLFLTEIQSGLEQIVFNGNRFYKME